jgi:hypothetical protein
MEHLAWNTYGAHRHVKNANSIRTPWMLSASNELADHVAQQRIRRLEVASGCYCTLYAVGCTHPHG